MKALVSFNSPVFYCRSRRALVPATSDAAYEALLRCGFHPSRREKGPDHEETIAHAELRAGLPQCRHRPQQPHDFALQDEQAGRGPGR